MNDRQSIAAPAPRVRIVIYGGTNLPDEHVRLVRDIARELLAFPEVVLLSGGFDGFTDEARRSWQSVDRAVLAEACERLSADELARRFETWVPRAEYDRSGVRRFRAGKVTQFAGTAQARRFQLVRGADALVSAAGEGNTVSVLELALALEKPVLPISYTGGDSEAVWSRHGEDVRKTFGLDAEFAARLERPQHSDAERRQLATDIARVVHRVAPKRCLVLMPFGEEHDRFYNDVVRDAIHRSDFVPHRIDKDDLVGNIPTLFRSALESCRAVVVDLTGCNPNVMYELGHAHARHIPVFLIARRRSAGRGLEDLPFYLRQEKVVIEADDEAGHATIAEELCRYLAGRTSSPRVSASQ